MTRVSLSDAFVVGYISEGPTRNRCHVIAMIAIDIIGMRTPNLDPEVICCKVWSKVVSYLNEQEIWSKYGILSQWWLQKKPSTGVLAVLSFSWGYPVNYFLGYSISQEICTRFCCALLCCGYVIVHNKFTWSIYPYSSGLLCWHWGNRQIATVPVK